MDILFPLKLKDMGEIEENYEKGQSEILENLRLNKKNKAWILRRCYSLEANQIKDQNSNASANQNKENETQTAATQSEENDLQSATNQSQMQVTTDRPLVIFQNYIIVVLINLVYVILIVDFLSGPRR